LREIQTQTAEIFLVQSKKLEMEQNLLHRYLGGRMQNSRLPRRRAMLHPRYGLRRWGDLFISLGYHESRDSKNR
jgi:hypothetical protein